ncbi:MAG: hypothetical protein AB1721_03290 [Patescibacteria group bacterium]
MKLIGKSNEAEMIAEFLKGEYNSERFGSELKKALSASKADTKLISEPNLADKKENAQRKKLLGEYRGYGRNKGLFENFPDKNITWHKATFRSSELKKVKYINYNYWTKLSDETRLATDAAKNILAGKIIFKQSNDRFFKAAEAIKRGRSFPRLIFLSRDENSPVVVLEGHVRLTAYMLAPERIPDPLEVIIGFSEKLDEWNLY